MEHHFTSAGMLGVIHISDLDFTPRRIYWLSGTPTDQPRGLHAHKRTEQFVVCVNGSVELMLHDGSSSTRFRLDCGAEGVRIPPGCWRELTNFAPSTVILVVASTDYDPDDYIHSFDAFMSWAENQKLIDGARAPD